MPPFDWQRLLLDEVTLGFLGEVAVRTLLAYIVVFLFLKLAGRRGVRQLSLFELVVILTLGSAAGDMTFYEDVPLLPVLTVFVAMSIFYRATTALMASSPRLQAWIEGSPFTLIRDGVFELETLNQGNISQDEFLMELRLHGVEHLGQVRLAIVEINGDVSLYYYAAEQTRKGLSVLPVAHRPVYQQVPCPGDYACSHCGRVQHMASVQRITCPACKAQQWSAALMTARQA